MIENLRIQNFKSWQDTGDMPFSKDYRLFWAEQFWSAPTFSNVYLMLKQTVRIYLTAHKFSTSEMTARPVNLGTFRDAIHHEALSASQANRISSQ